MIELRRPQVIPDHRGTLVVIEGSAFECKSFTSARLLDLVPGMPVQLLSGRHVIVLLRGSVTVQSSAGIAALRDLNHVVVADGDAVQVSSDGEGVARVAILSSRGDGSGNAAKPISAKFVEIDVGERESDSVDIDWALQSPFQVKRVYFTHSVGLGAERGGHAHRRLRQVLIAAEGVIDLRLQSSASARDVRLDHPARGVLVQPVTWREIVMHEGSHLMVLASEPYDEAEYIREYPVFCAEAG